MLRCAGSVELKKGDSRFFAVDDECDDKKKRKDMATLACIQYNSISTFTLYLLDI